MRPCTLLHHPHHHSGLQANRSHQDWRVLVRGSNTRNKQSINNKYIIHQSIFAFELQNVYFLVGSKQVWTLQNGKIKTIAWVFRQHVLQVFFTADRRRRRLQSRAASSTWPSRRSAAWLMAPGVLRTYLAIDPHSQKCVSASGGAVLTDTNAGVLFFCVFFLDCAFLWQTGLLSGKMHISKKKNHKNPLCFSVTLRACRVWFMKQREGGRVRGGPLVRRDQQTVMYVYPERRAADAQKSVLQSPLKLGLWAKCRQNGCDARDRGVCAQGQSLIMCVLVICSKG